MDITVTHFFVMVIFVMIYFVLGISARIRCHNNKSAVALLNLFLGWTLLGWGTAQRQGQTLTFPQATPPITIAG